MSNKLKTFTNGIIKENPVLVLVLGTCPTIATSTSVLNALGAGLGFLLAMVLFAGVRGRMENMDIPESFQGLPITLIAASIVSMSFMGFSGVVDGLLK